nr:hypothetical protein [Deinococcus roseus]
MTFEFLLRDGKAGLELSSTHPFMVAETQQWQPGAEKNLVFLLVPGLLPVALVAFPIQLNRIQQLPRLVDHQKVHVFGPQGSEVLGIKRKIENVTQANFTEHHHLLVPEGMTELLVELQLSPGEKTLLDPEVQMGSGWPQCGQNAHNHHHPQKNINPCRHDNSLEKYNRVINEFFYDAAKLYNAHGGIKQCSILGPSSSSTRVH